MKPTSNRSSITAKWINNITGNLYECNSDYTGCQHRFAFGYALYYCSWLLNNGNSKGASHDLPCIGNVEESSNGESKTSLG